MHSTTGTESQSRLEVYKQQMPIRMPNIIDGFTWECLLVRIALKLTAYNVLEDLAVCVSCAVHRSMRARRMDLMYVVKKFRTLLGLRLWMV